MTRKYMAQTQKYRVIIDPLSFFCIVGSFIALGLQLVLFMPKMHIPEVNDIMIRSIVVFVLLQGGLIMMIFSGVYDFKRDWDWFIDAEEFRSIIVWLGGSMFMILVLNLVTIQSSPLFHSSIENLPEWTYLIITFQMITGWMEEVLFRGFLLQWSRRFAGDFVGVVFSTLTWWGFHGGVYGLAIDPMIIILGTGAILSFALIATKGRLSVTMVPHGLNNLFAGLIMSSTITFAPLVMGML